MSRTFNVTIPPTILRLGTNVIERLTICGIDREISRKDIQRIIDRKYPSRKRAANSIVRGVNEYDLEFFNDVLEPVRDEADTTPDYKLHLRSSYMRGKITIKIF